MFFKSDKLKVKEIAKFTGLLLSFVIAVAGLLLLNKFVWKQDAKRFIAFLGLLIAVTGAYLFCYYLTRLLVKHGGHFKLSSLTSEAGFMLFKEKAGNRVAKKTSRIFGITFITVFAPLIFFSVKYFNNYQEKQLKQYGEFRKVRVDDVRKKGKGGPYAFFEFSYKGKKYLTNLYNNGFHTGDSAEIIFSTQNPDIVMWGEDYIHKYR